jgi:hypothetical protein
MIIDDDLKKLRDEIEVENDELFQQLSNLKDKNQIGQDKNLKYVMNLLELFNKRSRYVETLVEKLVNEIQQMQEAS